LEKRQIGLYRNSIFEGAEELAKKHDFDGALGGYLAVLYIDENGPRNVAKWADGRIYDLDEPCLRHEHPSRAPGIFRRCAKCVNYSGVASADIRQRFIVAAARQFEALRHLGKILSPEEAWERVEPILQEYIATGTKWRPRVRRMPAKS
jgi:hypothetical protein